MLKVGSGACVGWLLRTPSDLNTVAFAENTSSWGRTRVRLQLPTPSELIAHDMLSH